MTEDSNQDNQLPKPGDNPWGKVQRPFRIEDVGMTVNRHRTQKVQFCEVKASFFPCGQMKAPPWRDRRFSPRGM